MPPQIFKTGGQSATFQQKGVLDASGAFASGEIARIDLKRVLMRHRVYVYSYPSAAGGFYNLLVNFYLAGSLLLSLPHGYNNSGSNGSGNLSAAIGTTLQLSTQAVPSRGSENTILLYVSEGTASNNIILPFSVNVEADLVTLTIDSITPAHTIKNFYFGIYSEN